MRDDGFGFSPVIAENVKKTAEASPAHGEVGTAAKGENCCAEKKEKPARRFRCCLRNGEKLADHYAVAADDNAGSADG